MVELVNRARIVVAVLALGALTTSASAYVDIELINGHHVLADSYRTQAGKVIVYRPSGIMEIDRAAIKGIEERGGDLPFDASAAPESNPAPAVENPGSPAAPSGAATAKSRTLQAQDDDVAHKLIFVHRDRLFARNRGDHEAVEKLDKEINQLVSERRSLRKRQDSEKDAPSN